MNVILKGCLGVLCLLLGPGIIVVSSTAVADLGGVILMLIGVWLIATAVLRGVRNARQR